MGSEVARRQEPLHLQHCWVSSSAAPQISRAESRMSSRYATSPHWGRWSASGGPGLTPGCSVGSLSRSKDLGRVALGINDPC